MVRGCSRRRSPVGAPEVVARDSLAGRCAQGSVNSLADELFLLQTMGDDRAIVETYVAGVACKKTISDGVLAGKMWQEGT